MSLKKFWLLLVLAAFTSATQADVLVILPQSGAMERAGATIKRGFMSAYKASGSKEKLIFADSTTNSMENILRKNVNVKTSLIIGPLVRSEIENIITLKPKVPVLALNDLNTQADNVWQFSLSKQEDASALTKLIKKDDVKKLFVLRQADTEAATELFMISLMSEFGTGIELVQEMPKKLSKKEGLLLLGSNQWVNQLNPLPEKNIYATPLSIEQGQPIPMGLSFCDLPALYEAQWSDLTDAYNKQPENMAFQRLLAFGGDAWMIGQQFVEHPQVMKFSFVGRTGKIEVNNGKITRQPHCYQQQENGIFLLK